MPYRDRDRNLKYWKDRYWKDPKADNLKSKAYRDTHKEKLRAYFKQYRIANADKIKAKDRAYVRRNADKIAAYRKAYQEANRAKLKVKQKEYYERNKPQILKKQQAYARANPEGYRRRAKLYDQRHPDRKILRRTLRRTQMQLTVEDESAVSNFIKLVRDSKWVRCYYCDEKVPGKQAHIDHIVPLARGGVHAIRNLCASCITCNCSKGKRLLSEWSPPNRQLHLL